MKVEAGDTPVHSYFSTRDQLAHQSERFRGRTSLFKEQISRGNASLRMTGLQLQDQGRYKCFTSTISGSTKESFINLRADGTETHSEYTTQTLEMIFVSYCCHLV